jgi:hypothetical protein
MQEYGHKRIFKMSVRHVEIDWTEAYWTVAVLHYSIT